MDKETLVSVGRRIVTELDKTELRPRFAMWVQNSEFMTWKLWLLPGRDVTKSEDIYRDYFRKLASVLEDSDGIDTSMVQLVKSDDPAVRAIATAFHVPGLSDVHLGNNLFNGYYMLDGILLRSDLRSEAA
jgi:hypothetical protein